MLLSTDHQFGKLKYMESSLTDVIYSKCEVSTQTNDNIEVASPENQDIRKKSQHLGQSINPYAQIEIVTIQQHHFAFRIS